MAGIRMKAIATFLFLSLAAGACPGLSGFALAEINTGAPFARNAGGFIDFNGDGDMLTVTDTPFLEANLHSTMTIEAWIRGISFSGFQGIVLKGNALDWNFHFQMLNNKLLFSTNTGNGQNDLVSNASLDNGKWYHVTAVYDSVNGIKQLYINGILDLQISLSQGAMRSNTSPLTIGGWNNGGSLDRFFYGSIDDVTIWNTARTQTEIQADMQGNLLSNASGLVADWRMNELFGDEVPNLAGSHSSALLTGQPDRKNSTHAFTIANGAIEGQLTAGDPTSQNVTYTIETQPSNGSIVLDSATGGYIYSHNGNSATLDSFTFSANNGTSGSNIQIAYIAIIPTNDSGDIGISQIVQFMSGGSLDLKDLTGDGVFAHADAAFLLDLIPPLSIEPG